MLQRAILVASIGLALPAPVMARTYHGRSHYVHCRHSAGTAGLVAGGIGGAILGGSVIGGGIAGPLIGGAAGALGGRAIDRSLTAHKRCYRD
jgi:hypothetical protein